VSVSGGAAAAGAVNPRMTAKAGIRLFIVKIPVEPPNLLRAPESIYRQREKFDQPGMKKEITPLRRVVSRHT
jgi:hypothetical protein